MDEVVKITHGIAISADAKRVGFFDLQPIDNLIEDRGGIGVVNGRD